MIGDQLKTIRRAAGKTLKDVEAATGIGNGYLSRIERGLYSPSIDTIQRICDAVGAEIIIQKREV